MNWFKKKVVISAPELQTVQVGPRLQINACKDPTAFVGVAPFHVRVREDLEKIESKTSGKQLLDALNLGNHMVTISYQRNGNMARTQPAGWYELRYKYNTCQANSAEPANPRDERVSKPGFTWFKGFGDELQLELQNYPGGKDALVTGLVDGVLYSWQGIPHPHPLVANIAGAMQRRQHVASKLDLWLAGTTLPSFDQADLLMLVMEPTLKPGEGASVKVFYDPNLAVGRPAEVGLYHELVHAYYSVQGRQLGVEDSSSEFAGGRHFELMSVGLPPFDARPFSENAYRRQLGGVPDRAAY